MRVKLSYTIEAEDVLREAAKLIGLQGEDMQQAVDLYQQVQKELKGEKEENSIVNIHRVLEMIDEFRTALLNIDRRLEEVTEIVQGYDDYLLAARAPQAPSADAPPAAPTPEVVAPDSETE